MRNPKKISVFLIFITLLCIGIDAFAENFSNNLLKTDLSKSSVSGLNLTLSTSKPYQDKVIVNKKSDTEYVVLMPETSNSIVTKPSISGVSDIVTSVDVKTQQFQGDIKGYTKITIKTNRPISINPKVQVATVQNKLSESDFSELLSSAKKTINAPNKLTQTTKSKTVVGTSSKTPEKKSTVTVISGKSKSNVVLSRDSKVAKQSSVQAQTKSTTKIAQKNIVKTTSRTSGKTLSSKPKKPESVIVAQESKEVVKESKILSSEEIKSSGTAQQILQDDLAEQKSELETAITEATEPEAVLPELKQNDQLKSSLKTLVIKYAKKVRNNIYLVLGIGVFVFLLLLLAARRMTRNITKAKAAFNSHLNEKNEPNPLDYTENISEDMDWQEKFQTYVETKEESEEDFTPKNVNNFEDTNPELNELFESPIGHTDSAMPQNQSDILSQDDYNPTDSGMEDFTPETTNPTSTINPDEYNSEEFYNSKVSPEDLFADENNDMQTPLSSYAGDKSLKKSINPNIKENYNNQFVAKTIKEQPPVSMENLVKSEFVIDDNKGFYLVDFEDSTALVGHINDNVFVLKRFNNIINAPLKARINEQGRNSIRYMTRVGNFRGVVEVTPEKMNLLVEL